MGHILYVLTIRLISFSEVSFSGEFDFELMRAVGVLFQLCPTERWQQIEHALEWKEVGVLLHTCPTDFCPLQSRASEWNLFDVTLHICPTGDSRAAMKRNSGQETLQFLPHPPPWGWTTYDTGSWQLYVVAEFRIVGLRRGERILRSGAPI